MPALSLASLCCSCCSHVMPAGFSTLPQCVVLHAVGFDCTAMLTAGPWTGCCFRAGLLWVNGGRAPAFSWADAAIEGGGPALLVMSPKARRAGWLLVPLDPVTASLLMIVVPNARLVGAWPFVTLSVSRPSLDACFPAAKPLYKLPELIACT